MKKKIQIARVKNVPSLDFDLPSPGVHVLTGLNGSGKTTLLAALYRIGHHTAFAEYFKTTVANRRLDNFSSAAITYTVGSEYVTYNYKKARWAPTPKRNSRLLAKLGYPQVKFIAANAKRIEPTSDELKNIRAKPVSSTIAQSVAGILFDDRFKDLRYISTKRGSSNRAFILPVPGKSPGATSFYSEKNFSLGELCVIKLVTDLDALPANSLVLIDEIEMALHPRAQSNLFDYLIDIAKIKNLTVIFSTHSASLIKKAGRGRILFLDRKSDRIECVSDCFPAKALGAVAIDEDISPDVIVFVEDDYARFLTEAILETHADEATALNTPLLRVVPVGPFKQVIEFLEASSQIWPDKVKRVAVLDEDVKSESLVEAKANDKFDFLGLYTKNEKAIRFLPCTPELGIATLLESDKKVFAAKLIAFSSWTGIDIAGMLHSSSYTAIADKNPRKKAKKQLAHLVNEVVRRVGVSEVEVVRKLCRFYVQECVGTQLSECKALAGRITA